MFHVLGARLVGVRNMGHPIPIERVHTTTTNNNCRTLLIDDISMVTDIYSPTRMIDEINSLVSTEYIHMILFW